METRMPEAFLHFCPIEPTIFHSIDFSLQAFLLEVTQLQYSVKSKSSMSPRYLCHVPCLSILLFFLFLLLWPWTFMNFRSIFRFILGVPRSSDQTILFYNSFHNAYIPYLVLCKYQTNFQIRYSSKWKLVPQYFIPHFQFAFVYRITPRLVARVRTHSVYIQNWMYFPKITVIP